VAWTAHDVAMSDARCWGDNNGGKHRVALDFLRTGDGQLERQPSHTTQSPEPFGMILGSFLAEPLPCGISCRSFSAWKESPGPTHPAGTARDPALASAELGRISGNGAAQRVSPEPASGCLRLKGLSEENSESALAAGEEAPIVHADPGEDPAEAIARPGPFSLTSAGHILEAAT